MYVIVGFCDCIWPGMVGSRDAAPAILLLAVVRGSQPMDGATLNYNHGTLCTKLLIIVSLLASVTDEEYV